MTVGADVDVIISVLRMWLARGACERGRHDEKRNSSAHYLSHKAMVWIGTPETRAQVGRPIWDAEPDFSAANVTSNGPPG